MCQDFVRITAHFRSSEGPDLDSWHITWGKATDSIIEALKADPGLERVLGRLLGSPSAETTIGILRAPVDIPRLIAASMPGRPTAAGARPAAPTQTPPPPAVSAAAAAAGRAMATDSDSDSEEAPKAKKPSAAVSKKAAAAAAAAEAAQAAEEAELRAAAVAAAAAKVAAASAAANASQGEGEADLWDDWKARHIATTSHTTAPQPAPPGPQ